MIAREYLGPLALMLLAAACFAGFYASRRWWQTHGCGENEENMGDQKFLRCTYCTYAREKPHQHTVLQL
jgi:hypothetical protein